MHARNLYKVLQMIIRNLLHSFYNLEILQRKRINRIYNMDIEGKIYFRKLTHTIVELSSPKSTGQTRKLEIQLRTDVAILSWKTGNSGRISILQFGNKTPFALGNLSLLIKPSTDWVRLTHILEGKLLYSKSIDLKSNYI